MKKKLKDVTIEELIKVSHCSDSPKDEDPLKKCEVCPFKKFLIDETVKKWCPVGNVVIFAYGLSEIGEQEVDL